MVEEAEREEQKEAEWEEAEREEQEEECAPEVEEEGVGRKRPRQRSRAGFGPRGAKRRPAIAPLKAPSTSALRIQRWGEGTQEGHLPPG